MIVTKDMFEKAVVTAINADAVVFDSMKAYLEAAENHIRFMVLGDEIYKDINSMPEYLKNNIASYISLKAFSEAIPFLDLILTPTGFGVVSTNTLAPASKERVERLLGQVKTAADDAMDFLILNLYRNVHEKWSGTPQFYLLSDSLYWTAGDLKQYAGMPDAHRSDLLALRPKIKEAENLIKRRVSDELFKEILESIRKNDVSTENWIVLLSMKTLVGYCLSGAKDAFMDSMDTLVNLLEEHLDKYKTYADSKVYQAKHFQSYENQKEDSVYFFGG